MKHKRNIVQAVLAIILVVGGGYVIAQSRAASTVVGDLNGDGVVNVLDLSVLLSDWGTSNATADLNHDGMVNILDLSVLLSHWGQTASPSPSASATPTPTPTPSASGIPQTTCTNPVFTSSALQGRWPATGSNYVNNNVWNTTEAGPQTISVCTLGSFYITANQPNLANDQGSVKSYPSTCVCGLSKPLNQYTNITSTFAESVPKMGEWNATYDLFMASGTEVMLDNETHNHPPQNGTAVTIDGVAYHALRVNSGFLVMANDNFISSGTVNWLHIFQWFEAQGWLAPTDAVNLFGYGVEISYTESSPGVAGPERFDVTNFSLTAN